MDIAKTNAGNWLIVELGDAQVAGLSDKINKGKLYKELNNYFIANTLS